MATKIETIINNLLTFYNFKDKIVLHVGAGGGQIIDYAKIAQHTIAIDIDDSAIEILRYNVKEKNLENKISIFKQDYYQLKQKCDVTFFEFCLHEMSDSRLAIEYAKNLSPDILIIDHMPESKWAWYVGETKLVQDSWRTIEKMSIKKKLVIDTKQFFSDFQELKKKLFSCGDEVQKRILEFEHKTNFIIPMQYGLVLI